MRFRQMMIVGLFALYGCGDEMNVQDFKDNEPELLLEDYFNGRTHGVGLFEDRFGNVRNQFTADVRGQWDGKVLTLDEDFRYADGKTEKRQWKITKTGSDTYMAVEDQVIGEALGQIAGNAFNWKYKFKLNVGEDIWTVRFDDWMFLQADGVLLNKATAYRWGVKIGTVFLTFQKASENGNIEDMSHTETINLPSTSRINLAKAG